MNSEYPNVATDVGTQRRLRSSAGRRSLSRMVTFVALVQSILSLAHWFVYQTWSFFIPRAATPDANALRLALGLLSVSFITASLLAHRYDNSLVRAYYTIAAVWLGTLNFLFLGAISCWIFYVAALLLRVHLNLPVLAAVILGATALASIYGLLNARRIRVKRIAVNLPGLPPSWRGRIAAHVTDTHLGHVNGAAFLRRIVAMLRQYQPDIVFVTGDMYDGTHADVAALAAPWLDLAPPFGAYFVTGNHEEFSDPKKYLDAIRGAGVSVLANDKVVVDGLQVVGVYYHDTVNSARLRSILQRALLDRERASIFLSHAPYGLAIADELGVSLQLSGHTHGGQLFPFTWFTRRVFGEYTYGLKRFRDLLVYTSTGAGTWGPPMRIGTSPEIVLIEFA